MANDVAELPAEPGISPEATGGRHAWFALVVLCVASVGSLLDRQIISLLVEPIKIDLSITDTQIGLLQGFAFSIFYAIAAIPLGRWIDRSHRIRIVWVGMAVWTIACLLCALSNSFWSLFMSRVLLGIGEAALVPAAYSLIADFFPRRKQAGAISIFAASTFLGAGLALFAGGWLVAWLNDLGSLALPLVGTLRPWQMAFAVVTLPTIVLLAILPLVREPPRSGVAPGQVQPPLGAAFAELFRRRALWIGIFGGLPAMAAIQSGLLAWVPSFFIRSYGWNASDVGMMFGLYYVVFGGLGALFGGWLCDRLMAQGRADAHFLTAMLGPVVNLPLVVVFALCGDSGLSAFLLAPITFFGTMPFAPGTAAIPHYAPAQMRGQLVALYGFSITLLGTGAGPWLIAFVTDSFVQDAGQLRYGIAAVALVAYPATLWLFLIGRRAALAQEGIGDGKRQHSVMS